MENENVVEAEKEVVEESRLADLVKSREFS